MKKLIYLIVIIVAFGLIVAGCLPVVPPAPTEQSEPTSLTRGNGIYYVAKTGIDSNDGSQVNPWLTISHALTQVSADDTIIVGPGTYLEWTGTPGAGCALAINGYTKPGLTIQSSGGAATTIIDCGWAGWGVTILGYNLTFSGFTVKNASSIIYQVSNGAHNLSDLILTDFVNIGLGICNAHNCTFSNITIHTNDVSKSEDRTVKGIDMQEYGSGGNTNNTFEDITIYDIETTGTNGSTYGIYWEGDYQATHPTTNNTFTNVTIHDMTGPWWEAGIYMVGKDTPGDNLPGIEYTTFSGGNIYNCRYAIFVQDGCSDVSISGFDFTNIDYNVIRFEGGGTGLMSNIAITENACLSTTIYTAITVANTGSGSITISNNDVRNNGTGIGIFGSTDATFVKAHCNNIEGNTGYGVKNYGIGTLDATLNWWGDASGPSHSTNPSGKGDEISDYVDFDPWLGGVPVIDNITISPLPAAQGETINLIATFTGPIGGTASATIDWGDGNETDGLVTVSNGAGTVTGSNIYSSAGVYTVIVTLTITNDCTSSYTKEFSYAVVYDPSEGFVTGGGWIYSEAGAYVTDPSAEGKAIFGFVSKYKKGATVPTGKTEFQFKAGDLNFHSDTYEWLVIAGAKAMYKGTGTINGMGEYKFMISAIDADINENNSLGVDCFRIKIWGSTGVIYDNQMEDDEDADPTTTIGGGQIVIHKK